MTKNEIDMKENLCNSIEKMANFLVSESKSKPDRELLNRIYEEVYMIRKYVELIYKRI